MKKIFLSLLLVAALLPAMGQNCYWVFLTDKQGTTFDPYTYFDAKALERYSQCGADLYDYTNYPLVEQYVAGVSALATEQVGCSRWMNAIGVMATAEQAEAIEALPYVLRVQPLEADGLQLATASPDNGLLNYETVNGPLEAQLVRMGGKSFRDHGIDGRGIRIAVFDGGFPRVNTHDAFKHLRDNHLIIKTWNFPNNRENVYGWNSHGLMTLSCIAGRIDGKDLGLATGAEFLLARTEVETEPFKEEVWWQMAVEWADKNGANIISSSLGYGKERHYTRDMDGTSYVARAANLAASKGILVVNSAGNEATESQWKTIITPADAEHVLCVGGIENNLREYNHITFSSYGPSADGRLKPNVCAFGYARTAHTPSDQATHYVHGTSFSCPLVAGFAACAWQTRPGMAAKDLFREIEHSADLYPYYDYAFGYGVPQADYFVSPQPQSASLSPRNEAALAPVNVEGKTQLQPAKAPLPQKAAKAKTSPTFRFVEDSAGVNVYPTQNLYHLPIFYKEQRPDGSIVRYGKKTFTVFDTLSCLSFDVAKGNSLVVHIDGYTASCTPTRVAEVPKPWAALTVHQDGTRGDAVSTEYRDEKLLIPSPWGSNAKWRYDGYLQWGDMVRLLSNEQTTRPWSPTFHVGFRLLRALSKPYCIGLGLEYAHTDYNLAADQTNPLDYAIPISNVDFTSKRYNFSEMSLELFQRVRLVAGGIMGKGLHWDLGLYASYGWYNYTAQYTPGLADKTRIQVYNPDYIDNYRLNWGLATRLSYDWIGLYCRYRMTGIGSNDVQLTVIAPNNFYLHLPRLEAGIQLAF